MLACGEPSVPCWHSGNQACHAGLRCSTEPLRGPALHRMRCCVLLGHATVRHGCTVPCWEFRLPGVEQSSVMFRISRQDNHINCARPYFWSSLLPQKCAASVNNACSPHTWDGEWHRTKHDTRLNEQFIVHLHEPEKLPDVTLYCTNAALLTFIPTMSFWTAASTKLIRNSFSETVHYSRLIKLFIYMAELKRGKANVASSRSRGPPFSYPLHFPLSPSTTFHHLHTEPPSTVPLPSCPAVFRLKHICQHNCQP